MQQPHPICPPPGYSGGRVAAPQRTEVLHAVGIDVETRQAARLRRALQRWKDVRRVESGGAYWANRAYSQIHVWTTLPLETLERRLDALNHVDHIGVFPLTGT